MQRKPTAFEQRVYAVTKKVPKGQVTTYKDIAHALRTKAYRAVGSALNKNPYAPKVPCHRVINASGNIGGFASGTKNKIKMLKKEGITFLNNKTVDLKKHRYKRRGA